MKFEGKTIIELKDAKTGKLVQRTEDHNMLTNALTEFYKQGGMTNPSAFGNGNIRTDALHYLLGGVLLLDTALDESASLIRVPSGVGMTGNGAYNVLNSGNPPELGSWNENESGWQQDGSYKMVWDFTTSQANGTVACVCLTSLYHGLQGHGNKSATYRGNNLNIGNHYNSITAKGMGEGALVGFKNNQSYIMNGNFKNKTSIEVNVFNMPVTSIDLRNVIGAELVKTMNVQLPSELQNLGGYTRYIISTHISGNLCYILIAEGFDYDNRISGAVKIAVFDVTTEAFTNVYTVDITSESPRVDMSGLSDKYVILGLTRVNFLNVADADDITDEAGIYQSEGGIIQQPVEALSQKIFVGGNRIIDIDTGELLPLNSTDYIEAAGGYLTASPLQKLCRTGVVRDPRYIATINNLEAPVTKTADKTMKVTYVVRFS